MPLIDAPNILGVARAKSGVHVDVALRWNSDSYGDNIIAFANGVHTPNGGTHVDGFKATLSPTPTLSSTPTLNL